jgi:hypothetical protein
MDQHVLEARKAAVMQSRTLTHWTNKVAPLGEEKLEHVQLERSRVRIMKDRQEEAGNTKVLLEYMDLTNAQKLLVTGSYR